MKEIGKKRIKGKEKTKSIKRTLLIAMVGLSVCISVLSGIASGFILHQASNDNMISSVNSSAAAYNHYVQQAIDNFKQKAETLAQNKDITDESLSVDQRQAVMDRLAKKYGFVEVTVVDDKGVSTKNIQVGDRDYYQAAMKGNTFISSTLVRKLDQTTTLMIAAKIDNGTDFNGAVVATLSSDTFSKMIDDVAVGDNGYGFIVDKAGKIIAHKDKTNVTNFVNYIDMAKKDGSYADIASVVQTMITGKSGVRTVTLNGVQQCIGYSPIPGTDGWSIAVSANVGEMMHQYYVSVVMTIVLTLLFIVLSCLIAFWIANPIANPIVSLVRRIETLSEGDLHSEIPVIRRKDEIGVLADSFSSTVHTLQDYVGEISTVLGSLAKGDCTVETHQDYKGDFVEIGDALSTHISSLNRIFSDIDRTADQVAGGASQVSGGAQALAQGATEQAGSIEELSAAIAEIANEVDRSASHAESASRLSLEASAEVERGNGHMQQMTSAMAEISDTSNEIRKIIKTIEDIAFQTNILALNASVEAARAGAAGKGFAVVADEVRNLASKSSEAAKNTTALIEGSIHAVENGTQIARETAASLDVIIKGVGQTTDLIGKISAASNGQASSIKQVTLGVDQISAVVQTNSATSEESAATSEELSAQAQVLKKMLSDLKLKDASDAPQSFPSAASPVIRLEDGLNSGKY